LILTGIELKELRKSLGLTQEKLGELLFVSKRMVVNYEKMQAVPAEKVQLLHYFSEAKKEKPGIEIALEALIDSKLNDRLKYIEEMLVLINKGVGTTALSLDEFRDEAAENLKKIDKKLNDVS